MFNKANNNQNAGLANGNIGGWGKNNMHDEKNNVS